MLFFPIVQLRRKLRWQLMAVACGVAWILAANLSHCLAWAPTEVPIPNSLHQCLLQENQDTCQRQRASYLHWNSLQFQLLILTLFPSLGATGDEFHGELSNHAWQWLKHESMNQLQFLLSPTALRPSTIAFLNPTNKRADRTILRNRCVGMRKKNRREQIDCKPTIEDLYLRGVAAANVSSAATPWLIRRGTIRRNNILYLHTGQTDAIMDPLS